jgi:hypothetical protein
MANRVPPGPPMDGLDVRPGQESWGDRVNDGTTSGHQPGDDQVAPGNGFGGAGPYSGGDGEEEQRIDKEEERSYGAGTDLQEQTATAPPSVELRHLPGTDAEAAGGETLGDQEYGLGTDGQPESDLEG